MLNRILSQATYGQTVFTGVPLLPAKLYKAELHIAFHKKSVQPIQRAKWLTSSASQPANGQTG
jgi:hypothetical protein